ncbi:MULTISPECIES: hypothetical protein [unclassified Synechocystis]|uniref:hypothetical protein n=1 Tax=unclassified Synechocystis TaxID=2640012 RepID=UPI0004D17671|nr:MULTISPECIES: hypothetical protein [unclassified Synechocystis]AIE73007.1 hypothetical protein D082_04780 [Synechocystis sp. PCC 6714]MCT0253529.1 hypothetical protein [Synechocystis sp. CS-94]
MKKLEAANQKLKAGKVHLTLQEFGGWLSARGMFPRKDGGEGKTQQRLPLGITATPAGIDRAFALCLEIRAALDCDRFRWADWLPDYAPEKSTFGDWIEALGADYLAKGGKQKTWEKEYLGKCFNKVDWSAPLDGEVLRTIVIASPADSRTRRRLVGAYAQLLKFAGLPDCVSEYRGKYSPLTPVNPRNLPPDSLLLDFWAGLDADPWGTVAGLMIVYGLRNYECFCCDLIDYPTLYVDRGKTDRERFVFPLLPQWAERLDPSLPLPDCHGDNEALGSRVTHAFKRLGLTVAPYNIRHCWARRAFEQGLATDLAAALMGHGEEVHRKTYQRWIEKQSFSDRFYGSLKG